MGLFDKFKKKKIEMTDEEEMYFYTEQEINEYEFCPADKEILERIKCSTAR